jgi:hypothetical protein
MTRGMLVPRADEDTDDDALPIFEGPGAVPLGAVDETDAARRVVSGHQFCTTIQRDGILV